MLERRVERTLRERDLVQRGSRVLLACSGGPDSAAMLAALHALMPRLGYAIVAVASVDHGLRSQAREDVEIAAEQAHGLNLPFHPLQVQLQRGASLQAQARRARYAALRELGQRLGADRIAVGHTLDDQAETVLQRMLRGGGLTSLAGIEPRRADGVIRPLLDCRRKEVQAYARARFPRIADDTSNRDPRFTRVRIRTEVLPMLGQEDPAVVRHLAALADEARCHRDSLAQRAAGGLKDASDAGGGLCLATLVGMDAPTLRDALRQWVCGTIGEPPAGGALHQLEAIVRRGKGEVWLPAGHVARAAHGVVEVAGPGVFPSSDHPTQRSRGAVERDEPQTSASHGRQPGVRREPRCNDADCAST